MDWPPPPPPPLADSIKTTDEKKNISRTFQPNGDVDLPFPAASAPPPRAQQARSHSMLEREELDDMKVPASTSQFPSNRRGSDGAQTSRPKITTHHRRKSTNWPPPPPPPPLTNSVKTTDEKKNISTIFQKNGAVDLPFSTAPAPPSRSRQSRRHSMLELEELDDVKDPVLAPQLPSGRRRSDGECIKKGSREEEHPMYSGARSDYFLGDIARCPTHMITESCPQVAFEKVSELKNYDFAFIKRSDGSWTYAIVAHRYHSHTDDEDFIMFVLDEAGSTKEIKQKQWANFVRCVAGDTVNHSIPMNISVDFNKEDSSIISSISFH